jgi:thiol-disulfide isomerase/thioredoxin
MRNVIVGLAALPSIGAATVAALGALGASSRPALADEGAMPDLGGAIDWLNTAPLTSKSLRGKVVLVDFWTYTCINSLRPLPHIRAWADKYKGAGLVVIGVHTPEFPVEKERANVERAVGRPEGRLSRRERSTDRRRRPPRRRPARLRGVFRARLRGEHPCDR